MDQRAGKEEGKRSASFMEPDCAGVLDILEEGVFHVGRDFRLVRVNPSGAALLGRRPEELRGRTVWEAVPGSWCPALAERIRDAFDGNAGVSFEVQCPEPPRILLQCRCLPVGDGIAVVMRDITPWKAREEHLEMQAEMDELNAIYSSAPIGLCVLDTDMRYVRINDFLARINGRPASEHIGHTPREMAPSFTAEMEESIRAVIATGEPRLAMDLTGKHLPGKGRPRSFMTHWLPIRDGAGKVVGVNVVVEDITDRKQAEEALRMSEANYRAIFDSANDAIFIHDARDGAILDANRAATEMYGYTAREMRGLQVGDISSNEPPYTMVEVIRKLRLLQGVDKQPLFEWRARDKSGRLFWVEVSLKQTVINGEQRIVALVRDITVRRHLEEALRESEERFRLIAESMPQLVWTTDPDGMTDYCNSLYRNYSGMGSFGTETPGVIHPDDVARTREAWERSTLTGEEYQIEHRIRRGDGVFRWHLSRGVPVRDSAGRVVKWYCTGTDIDEQKRAQEIMEDRVRERTEQLGVSNRKLEEQKEILQKIIDNIPVMIVLYDPSGMPRMVNREFTRIMGWTLEETQKGDILAENFPDPAQRRTVRDFIRSAEPGWRDLEPRVRGDRALPSSWAYIRLSDGSLIGIGIDISGRRKLELDLLRLAAAIEQAGEGVMVLGPGWVIEYVNPAFQRICGCSREELAGRQVSRVLDGFIGETGWGEVSAVLSQGRTWSSRQRCRKKDGMWVDATFTVSSVQDEKGGIINYVCIVRDVTQEARLQQQMMQNQKIEAIGTLAGGIAHDLKNIFTPIMINIEMALEDLDAGSPAQPILEEALQAARMGADLTRQIVTFSRRSARELAPVKISQVLREALVFLKSTLPVNVELRLAIDDEDDVVIADATQLKQVMLNLGNNAGYAMRDKGGTLDVALQDVLLDADASSGISPLISPGEYARIEFTDSGTGMDEQTLEHIFEPFYTTKEKGEGTGMGLAMVHGIVRDHKGAVTVRSKPGSGSTFTVFLPVAP